MWGQVDPALLSKVLKEAGQENLFLPDVLPPPGFLPSTADCYALNQGHQLREKITRLDGVAFQQFTAGFGKAREGDDKYRRGSRTKSAQHIADEGYRDSQRLKTSGSAVSTRSCKSEARSEAPSMSPSGKIKKVASRVIAADEIWKDFAPMAARDHVAQLMNHPLPTRGMNNAHNFHERTAPTDGPLPRVPVHIAMPQALSTDTFRYDRNMKKATMGIRFHKAGKTDSNPTGIQPNWHGAQKHNGSEHADQMVQMGHIVRH